MENNPQVVFERLFGDGGTDTQRRERRQHAKSLLDSVGSQVDSLKRDLPAADVRRLDQYLEEVREIERRVDRGDAGTDRVDEIGRLRLRARRYSMPSSSTSKTNAAPPGIAPCPLSP